MQIKLTVTAGPHQGKEFPFSGHDTFMVGRSRRAHFRLTGEDRYFSRFHFMIEVNPPLCRLMDMGSRNGTYVNGKRTKVADLQDGDEIRGGRTILQVSVENSPSSVPSLPEVRLPASPAASAIPAGSDSPAPPTINTSVSASVSARQANAESACQPCPACATATLAASSTLTALCPACLELARGHPQSIPGYQIIRELGRGGMGVVYLAVREARLALVALKTIIPEANGTKTHIERFLREADILRRLEHPHIVAFRDMGQSSGQIYFAMDYVAGTDAAHLIEQHGPVPMARAVSLVCQLLEALEYAHGQGIVHRDIKPIFPR